MIDITWFGHSMWKFDFNNVSVIIDPYTDIGYPLRKIDKADIVISTHNHFDHNNFSLITTYNQKISEQGHFSYENLEIDAIQVWHDKKLGSLRGKNLLIKIKQKGLSLLHCGDLGHIPDESVIQKLGRIDLLFVPIGGIYTIDAYEAKQLAEILNPKIIFPMHYQTPVLNLSLEKPEKFLSLFEPNKIKFFKSNKITLESLPDNMQIYVMNYA